MALHREVLVLTMREPGSNRPSDLSTRRPRAAPLHLNLVVVHPKDLDARALGSQAARERPPLDVALGEGLAMKRSRELLPHHVAIGRRRQIPKERTVQRLDQLGTRSLVELRAAQQGDEREATG